MPSLSEIEQNVRALLRPEAEYKSRPFLCDGSPMDCEVAIVGINPGTALPLWDYWNPEEGCDKAAWLVAFSGNPANNRKRTRQRIEWLIEELVRVDNQVKVRPVRCLELNIYPYVSTRASELPKELKEDTRVFEYLLTTIKPKLLFVFGNETIEELRALLKENELLKEPALPKGDYTRCNYADGTQFDVYADYHLTANKHWNEIRVRSLGQRFRNYVTNRWGEKVSGVDITIKQERNICS